MKEEIKSEGKFNYIEKGEGTPIIILHGLMGGLSNFDGVAQFFPENGYKVVIPELPLYSMPLLKTSVSNFAKYIKSKTCMLYLILNCCHVESRVSYL